MFSSILGLLWKILEKLFIHNIALMHPLFFLYQSTFFDLIYFLQSFNI